MPLFLNNYVKIRISHDTGHSKLQTPYVGLFLGQTVIFGLRNMFHLVINELSYVQYAKRNSWLVSCKPHIRPGVETDLPIIFFFENFSSKGDEMSKTRKTFVTC